ncbi:hypothetical protein Btru_048992 [Bulinus truncatus]|nr:hypothetical protein Btru_048992 [Bulinus truncatus]
MYCMSLTSSRFIVWLTGLIFTVFDYHPKISFYQERYLHLNNYDGTALRFSVASCFFDLSLVSFALEKICRNSLHHQTRSLTQIDKVLTTTPEQPRTLENNVPTFLDCIFYAFHLPKFVTGPFYSFRKFYPEVMDYFNASDNRVDILDVVKNLMRCMFWGVFMELQFHYFYSDGLGHSVYALERMSLAAVVSVGYWHGQCFTVKYVFFYGVSGQLLRFDGITPYANPRCISWIYSYADMWRYFDVGLYQFVKDYIYVPLGGSQSGFLRHTISSLVSFFFIYIWHGGRQNLFYWCLGSFIAVTLETFGRYLKRSRLVIDARSRLSPAMQLRLEAVLNYPVYLVSCWSAFFFFFGIKTTRVIIRRMILGPWHIMILEMLVFISAVHNAYYIGLVSKLVTGLSHCKLVTGLSYCKLVTGLSYCKLVTGLSYCKLVTGLSYCKLVTGGLSYCKLVTGLSYCKLVTGLSYCKLVTGLSYCKLVTGGLSYCKLVTGLSYCKLVTGLSYCKLVTGGLSYCKLVTGLSYCKLVTGLSYCKLVTGGLSYCKLATGLSYCKLVTGGLSYCKLVTVSPDVTLISLISIQDIQCYMSDVLPKWERIAYWIIGLGGIADGLYRLHIEGDELKEWLYHLEPGWSWLQRDKDTSDYGWQKYRSCYGTIMLLNLIHVLLSQMCHMLSVKAKIGWLSPAMQLRLEAILNYPVYLLSCLSTFFFFFGINPTLVMMRKMILGPWNSMILEMLVFVSAIHNAYIDETIWPKIKKMLTTC